MEDRHKRRPRAVRLPDGLEAWLLDYARKTGQSVNGIIVAALEAFRASRPTEEDRSEGSGTGRND